MRRTLFLLLALTAVVGIAVGSGGFTSVSADRGVSVDVVGDENAYMALEYDNGDEDNHGNGNVGNSEHRHGEGQDPGHSHGEGFDPGHIHGNSSNSETDNSGEDVTFVTVRNQFTEQVDITVYYTVTGEGIEPIDSSETKRNVGVGEGFDVSVALDCESNGPQDATVSFDVEASGDSVFAETTESRHVDYRVICNNGKGDGEGEDKGDGESESKGDE